MRVRIRYIKTFHTRNSWLEAVVRANDLNDSIMLLETGRKTGLHIDRRYKNSKSDWTTEKSSKGTWRSIKKARQAAFLFEKYAGNYN